MVLRIKAFIFRFFGIFGIHLFLAGKEQDAYIKTQKFDSQISKSCLIGLWQTKHGFTSVWTYGMSFHEAVIAKVKHAFYFKGLKND